MAIHWYLTESIITEKVKDKALEDLFRYKQPVTIHHHNRETVCPPHGDCETLQYPNG